MFIGRKQELQFLEDKYHASAGQLVVLYGRRRVGKTETLREFCKGKPHVFYSCREVADRMQLRSFSEKLLRENIPAANYINEFADWESALKSILDLPYGDSKKLLILSFIIMCFRTGHNKHRHTPFCSITELSVNDEQDSYTAAMHGIIEKGGRFQKNFQWRQWLFTRLSCAF